MRRYCCSHVLYYFEDNSSSYNQENLALIWWRSTSSAAEITVCRLTTSTENFADCRRQKVSTTLLRLTGKIVWSWRSYTSRSFSSGWVKPHSIVFFLFVFKLKQFPCKLWTPVYETMEHQETECAEAICWQSIKYQDVTLTCSHNLNKRIPVISKALLFVNNAGDVRAMGKQGNFAHRAINKCAQPTSLTCCSVMQIGVNLSKRALSFLQLFFNPIFYIMLLSRWRSDTFREYCAKNWKFYSTTLLLNRIYWNKLFFAMNERPELEQETYFANWVGILIPFFE